MDLPPHDVPAKGVLEWELIALPAPFKTDTWVTSMEILPGDASVVHHICFSFEKHKPTTVYNRYEWVQVPRDRDRQSHAGQQRICGVAGNDHRHSRRGQHRGEAPAGPSRP